MRGAKELRARGGGEGAGSAHDSSCRPRRASGQSVGLARRRSIAGAARSPRLRRVAHGDERLAGGIPHPSWAGERHHTG